MPAPFDSPKQLWKRLASWPRRMSIVTRLVVLLLVVLLVPLSITSSLSMSRAVNMMEENEYLRLQQESRAIAVRGAQLVSDTSRMLNILQTDPALVRVCIDRRSEYEGAAPKAGQTLRDRVVTATRALLARAAAWNPDLDQVALADNRGRWLAFSDKPIPEHGQAQEQDAAAACAKRALDGETLTAEVLGSKGEQAIYFAAPVQGEGQELIGALVVRMKPAALQKLCTSELVPKPQVALLHAKGEIFADTDPARTGGTWRSQIKTTQIKDALVEREERSGKWFNTGRSFIPNANWTVLVAQPSETLEKDIGRLRRQQTAIALWAASAVLLLALFQAREITRPLRALRLAAIRVARGDLSAKAPILLHDEIGELAHTFNHMTDRLREHDKLRGHLRLAQDIQRGLLPAKAPAFAGLDMVGFNRPADETGGDYFDFVDLSEWAPHHLAIFIGDVTGHGVPAALLMATARAHIRAAAYPPRPLDQVMADANRRILQDTPPGRFITVAALLIDTQHRRLHWSTAGHDGPMLFDPAKNRVSDLEGEDIPLGVDPGWRFHQHGGGTVPPGSVIVLGTDGVWETRNANGEEFGKERLRELILQHHAESAEEIRRHITLAVDEFRGVAQQEDDVTLVVVKMV